MLQKDDCHQKEHKWQMITRMWRKRNPCTLWECELVPQLWKTVWQFLEKLKIELPYNPTVPFLGIYLGRKKDTLIWKATFTPVFVVALFIIAKIWKQLKCPLTDKWRRLRHTHTHTHTHTPYIQCSTTQIKRNENLPFATISAEKKNCNSLYCIAIMYSVHQLYFI